MLGCRSKRKTQERGERKPVGRESSDRRTEKHGMISECVQVEITIRDMWKDAGEGQPTMPGR